MGVSTAVLESVIFVHQEESCWPLAEDKVRILMTRSRFAYDLGEVDL
jgi:hypothetical protein